MSLVPVIYLTYIIHQRFCNAAGTAVLEARPKYKTKTEAALVIRPRYQTDICSRSNASEYWAAVGQNNKLFYLCAQGQSTYDPFNRRHSRVT